MSDRSGRALSMAALILSANAIFGLPFDIARIFRPTVLDVFGITNLELGTAFASYGVTAMIAYFPGGPLADRFSARRLMVVALLATAAGGAVMATIPPISVLRPLFAFWGVTTVLFFWAALIRATREWGGHREQGRAYGILDGGRGLAAAAVASLTVAAFAALLPADVASASLAERTVALQRVIWIITGMTAGAALLVWFWIPEGEARVKGNSGKVVLERIAVLLRTPTIWIHALIVVGTSLAMYALRGIYFALFEEASVPSAYTGAAVGVVSVIGFTPDIFMGPIMGFLLDRSPGALGHQHVFAVLAVFSALGLVAAVVFRRLLRTADAGPSTDPTKGPTSGPTAGSTTHRTTERPPS